MKRVQNMYTIPALSLVISLSWLIFCRCQ